MVGVKVSRVWLIRESKGSDTYYLTGDPEFVKFFKEHRRHWGNLIWARGIQENRRYSYPTHLWLLKTYLIILEKTGKGWGWPWYSQDLDGCPEGVHRMKTEIGDGTYSLGPEHVFKDTYRFNFESNCHSGDVIKSFRCRFRFIEGLIWNYRNFLGTTNRLEEWSIIKSLIEPQHKLPRTPEGPYDLWRMPPKDEKKPLLSRLLSKILKKIRAA